MLGPPPKNGAIDKRPVYVELNSSLTKKDIIFKTVTERPWGIFANEYLIGNRRHLFNVLLEFRKTNRAQKMQIYSRDGVIHVRCHLSESPMLIRSEKELERLIKELERK